MWARKASAKEENRKGGKKPSEFGPFWESETVYPNFCKYMVSEISMQKGSDYEAVKRRKNKVHVKASVEKDGVLKLAMYHVEGQKMHTMYCDVDKWHSLGWGPLEWMSWEQRCFVAERIASGSWWDEKESVGSPARVGLGALAGIMGPGGGSQAKKKTLVLQSVLTPVVSAHTLRIGDREIKLEVRDLGTYFYVSGSGMKFFANETHWSGNTKHKHLRWIPVRTRVNLAVRLLRQMQVRRATRRDASSTGRPARTKLLARATHHTLLATDSLSLCSSTRARESSTSSPRRFSSGGQSPTRSGWASCSCHSTTRARAWRF